MQRRAAGELQMTLRKLTETLARELAAPGTGPLDWSAAEWVLARAVVVLHGISQSLIEIVRGRAPDSFVEFLEQQRAHIATRHGRIDTLLAGIDLAARAAGIPITALKGAALHAMGIHGAGDRPMADIDLLVRPAAVPDTKRLLEALGYREHFTSWKECVFVPLIHHPPAALGEHADNDIKIELHERICERLPLRLTDVSTRIFPSLPERGLNSYPDSSGLMVHLLLHAAGCMAFKALRCVQLHDIALLSARMSTGDWEQVAACVPAADALWWAAPPLRMTAAYFPGRIPDWVVDSLERHCPPILGLVSRRQCLSDVSYSYLWVNAFPGIEWSQSWTETLEYVVQRVRPSRAHAAFRVSMARSQAWAADNRWTVMPQSRRIVRWLVARQPRPPTLHAIRAALGQRQ